MRVVFNRRAEIALRSLDPNERRTVESVSSELAAADTNDWKSHARVAALQMLDGQQYYSVRAGDSLRLLAKIIADALIVEDIFSRQRLEQIAGIQLP